MAHAYTPGLKVTKGMTIQKERRLPLEGEVLVETGATVKAEDVVAKADLPGNVQLVNVANLLSVPPEEVAEHMLKPVGETVSEDEIIATTKGLFGLFKSQARSPIDGTIEAVSDVTGQVILREPPIPVEVKAYTDGTVTETLPNEGVTVETFGTYIQGIFGIGGETVGNLTVVAESPNDALIAEQILPEHRDNILVGGSLVTTAAIEKAIQHGVRGIITGGIDDADLRELLGYELGVAITGSEEIGNHIGYYGGVRKHRDGRADVCAPESARRHEDLYQRSDTDSCGCRPSGDPDSVRARGYRVSIRCTRGCH